MISTNFRLNKSVPQPFLLRPAAKDYLWGGSRLNDDFSKEIDLSPLAETWECSIHPDGVSTVASGEYAGMTLKEVLEANPSFLGRHKEMPILIKFIDAKKDLSIQVHPDDEYAILHEGSRGKTEMWYVLDATKDAAILYGLKCNRTVEEVRQSIEMGSFEQYLQKIPVKADDVFFIPAGTIHAIGKGCLIAEIQENSNLTYRLYDYGRIKKDGRKRELQIEKGLEAATLNAADELRQPMRTLRYQPGMARELLCRCRYFLVHRVILNTERVRNMAEIVADELSFRVLLCYKGCGCAFWGDEMIRVFKGDCIFVPAGIGVKMHGKLEMLEVGG